MSEKGLFKLPVSVKQDHNVKGDWHCLYNSDGEHFACINGYQRANFVKIAIEEHAEKMLREISA